MNQLFKGSYNTLKLWASLLLIATLFSQCYTPKKTANTQSKFSNYTGSNISYIKDKSSLKTTIEGFGGTNMFTKKNKKIGYSVNIINTLKEEQSGNITMNIANAQGLVVYSNVQPFSVRRNGVYEKNYEFDAAQLSPGMYVSNIAVETDKYADAFNYSFGYEVEKQVSPISTPADFVAFWQNAQSELNTVTPNYKVLPRPDIKNNNADAYEVQFNSTGNAVIYSWLTVPKNRKSSPVLYYISDYMSELKPEFRSDVAVFSLHIRGAGGSTSNYNYDYNTLGLLNINDKNKYILRGMFLDGLRGLDFLKSGSNGLHINGSEIIISGNGLGASVATFVATLNPSIKALIMESPSFTDIRNTINFNEGITNKTFPSSMFYSYYSNGKKGTKEAMLNTLDYFDAVNFAPYISSPTLVGFGLQNNNIPSSSVYSFYNQLRVKRKKKYVCDKCGVGLDKGFYGNKEAWIKEYFKLP